MSMSWRDRLSSVVQRNRDNQSRTHRADAGFSLIEILVALAIIATLAALVGPRLLGQVDKSKVTTARVQIKMLETALTTYYADGGGVPTADTGLSVLVQSPNGAQNWDGPYLAEDELPLDPWGFPYQYVPPDRSGDVGDVFSFGADGQAGGDGQNADIYS